MLPMLASGDWSLWLFLSGAALLAGTMDAIAGGGGLITVPVLLSVGISPAQALATNKLQACFGSGTALWRYARAGLVPREDRIPAILWTALGAVAGTLTVRFLSPEVLQITIPIVLGVIFFYLLVQPRWGEQAKPALWPLGTFYAVFGLTLGFYDGFLGPGTGSFWTVALTGILGYGLAQATAQTKLVNFTSNVVSLAVFLSLGQVLWGWGLLMGVFQALGARLGSWLALTRGVRFIRGIFLVVVTATIAKLLISSLWH